jgi:hypothetical protein|tara:strand:- start:274 stop:1506 length:1233 start_codon:yes stop_codon:yes gene_type:complete
MAGRLRLAATGVQDEWLTGEPQFSYFLTNFKRHSKFAFDYVESQFDGDIDFDKTITCRVPGDKGDLVKNLTLKITLQDPTPEDSGSNDNIWCPSVITHLIEHADLLIGGQMVERLTGEYIYMHQQLYNTSDDVDQTIYFLTGHGNILSYASGTNYTYFLELPFYFYRNPSLAIPTCALTKQVVEVRIKTRPLSELTFRGSLVTDVASIPKFSMDTEFIYVSPDESNFMKSRPLDYLITQVQMSKFKMKASDTTKSVMLNFKHPVKELFFVSQSDVSFQNNYPNEYNTITNAELRFNNEVVFNQNTKFLAYEQSLKHHVNSPYSGTITPGAPFSTDGVLDKFGPAKFGMYSFSLKPEVYYPTGQVNMSRISHKLLKITIDPKYIESDSETRVYAVNYNVLRINSGLAGLKF